MKAAGVDGRLYASPRANVYGTALAPAAAAVGADGRLYASPVTGMADGRLYASPTAVMTAGGPTFVGLGGTVF